MRTGRSRLGTPATEISTTQRTLQGDGPSSMTLPLAPEQDCQPRRGGQQVCVSRTQYAFTARPRAQCWSTSGAHSPSARPRPQLLVIEDSSHTHTPKVAVAATLRLLHSVLLEPIASFVILQAARPRTAQIASRPSLSRRLSHRWQNAPWISV